MKDQSVDTIVAPATPIGEGGIGIVRISGPGTEALLLRTFSPSSLHSSLETHRLYHGHIRGSDGSLLDEVMVVLMRAPRSYTREDVGEIHCHGGPRIIRKLVDLLVDYGARLARPGEFTLRAFLNGRIDLTRAEAVSDLISAHSDLASRMAFQQMDGSLYRTLKGYALSLRGILARLEADIDFAEEDLPEDLLDSLNDDVSVLLGEMDRLISTFDVGRVLRDGLSVILLGRPNVGKSSLLNILLGEDRAIVTDVPGTTRDLIEEDLQIGGLPLRLIDTAGIRESNNPIEQEGVRRAKKKVESADIVLHVVDGSQPLTEEDLLLAEVCPPEKRILVLNKSDICTSPPLPSLGSLSSVRVSALTGDGIDLLRDRIVDSVMDGRGGAEAFDGICITKSRHREALVKASQCLRRFLNASSQGLSLEFLAIEVVEALRALGEITGETTSDDVLNIIFSSFCIGK